MSATGFVTENARGSRWLTTKVRSNVALTEHACAPGCPCAKHLERKRSNRKEVQALKREIEELHRLQVEGY